MADHGPYPDDHPVKNCYDVIWLSLVAYIPIIIPYIYPH
jgi:hypothetical protein